jgi:hypothetical protein
MRKPPTEREDAPSLVRITVPSRHFSSAGTPRLPATKRATAGSRQPAKGDGYTEAGMIAPNRADSATHTQEVKFQMLDLVVAYPEATL